MIPLPPRATRTYPLCPYTPHFRSDYLDPASMAAALEGISAAFVVTPDFLDEQRAMEILCAEAKSRKTLRQILRILRSAELTSVLQSLMRISYAVFCLKKNTSSLDQPIIHY